MWWYLVHKYFARRKEKHSLYIFSPFDGKSKALEKIRSVKCDGCGVLIVPDVSKKVVEIHSPIDGEILNISSLGDKVVIRSDCGVEVLIKVLAKQEKLKRTGVSPFVFKGQWVNVGDQISSMHVDHLKQIADFKGVIIAVTSSHKIIEKKIGEVTVLDKVLIVGEKICNKKTTKFVKKE